MFIITGIFLQHATGKDTVVHLRGKLLNCKEKVLRIVPMGDLNEDEFTDSIMINGDGSFHYNTHRITRPVTVSITNFREIQIPVFLAPSYDLVITADVSSNRTLHQTLAYSGTGAGSNRYWAIRHQAFFHTITPGWLNSDITSFKENYLQKPDIDSITAYVKKEIFGPQNKDPFSDYFSMAAVISIRAQHMLRIFMYSLNNGYSFLQTDTLLKKYGSITLPSDADDRYLASATYIELLEKYYLRHLLANDYNLSPGLADDPHYKYERIRRTFSGRTRDLLLADLLKKEIREATGSEALEYIHQYIAEIEDAPLREQTSILFSATDDRLKKLKRGADAPDFRLPDTDGNIHQVADYRGKVIYIEFWASWCAPCIQQIPFLKALHAYYDNREELVFISIALNDLNGKSKRQEINRREKADWLQLEDTGNMIMQQYNVTYFPRAVVIDKHGKIAATDAPLPYERDVLKALLENEMNKP